MAGRYNKGTCMRAWNRAKLLWSYLTKQERVRALPVEYIVETTAKCNLYCPMCPRETHPQPKEDMTAIGRFVLSASSVSWVSSVPAGIMSC